MPVSQVPIRQDRLPSRPPGLGFVTAVALNRDFASLNSAALYSKLALPFRAFAAVFASMLIWIDAVVMLPFPLSTLVFGVLFSISYVAIHWTLRIVLLVVASCIFRVLRLMNAEEAVHFPLFTYGRHLKPWPENWQEPIHVDTDHGGGC